jgi:hypothetical protein
MFEIDAEQAAKIAAWSAEQDKKWAEQQGQREPYYGAIGGELTYEFTPTSLGVVTKVKHATGVVLDVTDYDSW